MVAVVKMANLKKNTNTQEIPMKYLGVGTVLDHWALNFFGGEGVSTFKILLLLNFLFYTNKMPSHTKLSLLLKDCNFSTSLVVNYK